MGWDGPTSIRKEMADAMREPGNTPGLTADEIEAFDAANPRPSISEGMDVWRAYFASMPYEARAVKFAMIGLDRDGVLFVLSRYYDRARGEFLDQYSISVILVEQGMAKRLHEMEGPFEARCPLEWLDLPRPARGRGCTASFEERCRAFWAEQMRPGCIREVPRIVDAA